MTYLLLITNFIRCRNSHPVLYLIFTVAEGVCVRVSVRVEVLVNVGVLVRVLVRVGVVVLVLVAERVGELE
jgi:hypothetical protein